MSASGKGRGGWSTALYRASGGLTCWSTMQGSDRMLINMEEADWDTIIKVYLKGTLAPIHQAAVHWRAIQKQSHAGVDARVVNTSLRAVRQYWRE
jgi:NAD(P)-dependent dehydrogenase (short-subunit alcohol dehydrogenase family)